jgi:hypothetical protein
VSLDSLRQLFDDAARGRFPRPDWRLDVMPAPERAAAAVVALTAHHVIAAGLQRDELERALDPADIAAPFNPTFLAWLGRRLEAKVGHIDATSLAPEPATTPAGWRKRRRPRTTSESGAPTGYEPTCGSIDRAMERLSSRSDEVLRAGSRSRWRSTMSKPATAVSGRASYKRPSAWFRWTKPCSRALRQATPDRFACCSRLAFDRSARNASSPGLRILRASQNYFGPKFQVKSSTKVWNRRPSTPTM